MKITKYLIILILTIGCKNLNENDEKASKETQNIKGNRGAEADSLFMEMINNKIITKPEEKKYISDIEKLKSVKLINCDSMSIHYKDLIDGKEIELKLSLKKFEKKNHNIKYRIHEESKYQDCELIDGKEPWGGYYGCPETEIENLEIFVNGNPIEMEEELRDVFDFQMCDNGHWKHFNPNPLLKYDKENGVFYLYTNGGQAADNYFGKFVFDENKFITRYLLDYVPLSKTGSFRQSFKGF
ncbi:MAG: hypothetical protein R3D00_23200 [Bacteroidia bacterium]